MLWLVILLFALAAGLFVVGVFQAVPTSGRRTVQRRLQDIQARTGMAAAARDQKRREDRRKQLEDLLRTVGEKVTPAAGETGESLRDQLIQAGYRSPNAFAYFMAARALLAVGLGVPVIVGFGLGSENASQVFLWALVGVGGGWMLPYIYLQRRIKRRKGEIRRSLPDALDLMVVCVEAGLGLNQALQRVADEMARISAPLADEFTMVNLQIRAGTPREDALRNMGERTKIDDVRSLMTMLIQTERFGTSVANALRVHSDTLRTKRQQEAEEQAAKVGIKILIPLVFFVFPAIFVVLLGPAVFPLMEAFGGAP